MSDNAGQTSGESGIDLDIEAIPHPVYRQSLNSEAYLAILNGLDAQIALVDERGLIVFVNDAWNRVSNGDWQPGSRYAIGANYFDVCRKSSANGCEQAGRMLEGIQSVLSGENSAFQLDYPCSIGSAFRWFRAFVTPIHSPCKGVVLSHVNISEQKSIECQLQSKETELSAINERMRRALESSQQLEGRLRESQKMEAFGTLAGGVVHDFNNVMTIIMGNAEMARLHCGYASDIARHLDEISSAAERARELVKQILTFGRKQSTSVRLTSLNNAIEESVRLLKSALPPNIELSVRCAPDLPQVLADPVQLEQIVLNLVTNSMQALGHRRGHIEVISELVGIEPERHVCNDFQKDWCRRNAGKTFVTIAVRDDGPGIPDNLLQRIFEPFFSTKPDGQGTGLGLAVLKQIVEDLGGAIIVDSRLGSGATFHVYIPAHLNADGSCIASAWSSSQGPDSPNKLETLRGLKVLCFEPDLSTAQTTVRLLNSLQHAPTVSVSASGTFELFRQDPAAFDVVVVDGGDNAPHGLALTTGWLVQRIRELRADVPIVYLEAEKAVETSCDNRLDAHSMYVTRPLDLPRLANCLSKLCGR